jgi:ABC-type lipoprotein export system ATPase subunit
MTLFQDLWREGITILLVTHERDIAAYAPRVIEMLDGQVRSDRAREGTHA